VLASGTMAASEDLLDRNAGDGGPSPGHPELLVAPRPVLERGLVDSVGAAKLLDPFRPVVVVVPDVSTAARVWDVLAHGLGAVAAVEVFTFGELVETLAAARHGAARDDLTPLQERALCACVAAGAKGWFEPLAGTGGLADAFCTFMAELRGARVSPGALTRAGLPIEIRRKLSSIAACADDFETRRGRRRAYEDRVEDATIVVERAMKRVPLMWYGARCDSDAEARLLERVCHAATVTAFVPAVRPPATAALELTLNALRRAGAAPMTEPPAPEADTDVTALSHLQRHLYRMPEIEAPPDYSVALGVVADPAIEVEEAARACLDWAADGIELSTMAVICPPEGPHADLVVDELRRAELPVCRHHSPPLSATIAGTAVLALVDAPPQPPPAEVTWSAHTAWFTDMAAREVQGSGPCMDAIAPLGEMDAIAALPDTATFLRQVRLTLEREPSGAAPAAECCRDGVTVLTAPEVGLSSFDAVCIVGVADGYQPRRPPAPVLLADGERRRLNEVLAADLPLAAARRSREPYDFAAAVGAARERLLILRPATSLDGRPLAPSPLFRYVLIALSAEAVPAAGCDTHHLVGTPAPVTAATALDAADALRHLVGDRRVAASLAPRGVAGADAWLARRSGTRLTRYDGVVTAAVLSQLDDDVDPLRGGLSPTRLETYAGCPFRYLAENILGVHNEPAGDDLSDPDPRDRGSLVHEILEQFLVGTSESDPPRPERRDDHLALLDRITAERAAAWSEKGRSVNALARQVALEQVSADLHRWWEIEAAEADTGRRWRARLLEAGFGRPGNTGESPSPPLEIELASGPLVLSGRIDRIDVSADGDGFRVVDYKSGEIDGAAGRLAGGLHLQLPLYRKAAAALVGLPESSGIAEYFGVTRRGRFRRIRLDVDEAELREILDSLRVSLAEGDFHPEPGPACAISGGCELRSVCGRHIETLARTRADDPLRRAAADRRVGSTHREGS